MKLATRIHEAENSRRDIVLIHGTGARAEMWRRQIQPLVGMGFRCIVPDLRGHGESEEPYQPTSMEVHLSDLVETLDHVGVRFPTIFAGHSLGAMISVELAARRPELFEQVLAISMPGRVPALTTEAFRIFLGWPYDSLRVTNLHRYLGWRPRVLVDTNKHALEQIMHNFRTINYCDNVPNVHCPVHFAVGRLDPVAPYVHVESIHKALPNSTLEIIEWAGHNCMDSQPAAFDRWFFGKLADAFTS